MLQMRIPVHFKVCWVTKRFLLVLVFSKTVIMRPVVYPMVYSLAMGYEDSDHHLKLLHRGANDLMLLHTSFEFENGINKSYIVQYLIWA